MPPFIPQQQRVEAGLAQCEELPLAAEGDPQTHGSPPPSPIAIRQVTTNRIGRLQNTTTGPPQHFSAFDAMKYYRNSTALHHRMQAEFLRIERATSNAGSAQKLSLWCRKLGNSACGRYHVFLLWAIARPQVCRSRHERQFATGGTQCPALRTTTLHPRTTEGACFYFQSCLTASASRR